MTLGLDRVLVKDVPLRPEIPQTSAPGRINVVKEPLRMVSLWLLLKQWIMTMKVFIASHLPTNYYRYTHILQLDKLLQR